MLAAFSTRSGLALGDKEVPVLLRVPVCKRGRGHEVEEQLGEALGLLDVGEVPGTLERCCR